MAVASLRRLERENVEHDPVLVHRISVPFTISGRSTLRGRDGVTKKAG
jgi:hypothetical protein